MSYFEVTANTCWFDKRSLERLENCTLPVYRLGIVFIFEAFPAYMKRFFENSILIKFCYKEHVYRQRICHLVFLTVFYGRIGEQW